MRKLILAAMAAAAIMAIASPVWVSATPTPPSFKSQAVNVTATMNASGLAEATATCPAGTSVTGGGVANLNEAQHLLTFFILDSAPSGNGWRVFVEGVAGGFTAGDPVTIYAVCGSIS